MQKGETNEEGETKTLTTKERETPLSPNLLRQEQNNSQKKDPSKSTGAKNLCQGWKIKTHRKRESRSRLVKAKCFWMTRPSGGQCSWQLLICYAGLLRTSLIISYFFLARMTDPHHEWRLAPPSACLFSITGREKEKVKRTRDMSTSLPLHKLIENGCVKTRS